MSDDEAATIESQPAGDWSIHDAPSPADSVKSDPDDERMTVDGETAPSQPIQKRRRVTRACDECRRKKIKCDGKQPCTHCSVYSYGAYAEEEKKRRGDSSTFFPLKWLCCLIDHILITYICHFPFNPNYHTHTLFAEILLLTS